MTPARGHRTFALLAGGGTGGHTYPAIALAQALVERGHAAATIRFVGGRRGPEGRVVPDAGFAIDLLPGRGLQRKLSLAKRMRTMTASGLRNIWREKSAIAREKLDLSP